MVKKLILFIVLIFCLTSQVEAKNVYVDFARPDNTGNGLTWATAEKDMGAGITDSSNGDVILVRAATYTGANNRTLSLAGKAITIKSENQIASDVVFDAANSGANFFIETSETLSTVLSYVTLYRGTPGVYITNASPTFTNIIITDCNITGSGGGLAISGGAASLSNLTITACDATNVGGGILLTGGTTASLSISSISSCTALSGGGIYVGSSAAPTINRVKVYNNTSTNTAGGLYCTGSTLPVVSSSLFYTNTNNAASASVELANAGARLTNCTITGSVTGKDIILTNGILTNVIAWTTGVSNTLTAGTITHSNIRGYAGAGSNGNIDASPLFVSTTDFHIMAGGPGIDAGTATGLGANFLDYDGIAMTDGAGAALGAGVDIGALTFAGHGANGPMQLSPGLMLKLIDPLEGLQFRFACLSPEMKRLDDINFLD